MKACASFEGWVTDSMKRRSGGKGSLGENIAAGSPTQSPGQAVALWLTEASGYDHATNTCSISACGHYTQIVWSTTTAVGCAHVSCTNGLGDFNVCDFNPPGNYVGQSPY